MAMVARVLSAAEGVEHRICLTGQHREMLGSILGFFGLKSDFDLNIMTPNQDLTDITGAVLTGMRDVLVEARPDRVLVQGDTSTVLAAALAAFYAKVPVGHIEAGLRTGDFAAPWPEEMNRRLADALSDRHFAPTERARHNLLAEGLPEGGIAVTGNTVIDALVHVAQRLKSEPELVEQARVALPELDTDRRLILVTGHRRENFGAGFEEICKALVRLDARDDVEIVYPVHLNPNVHEPVHRVLGTRKHIHLTEPIDYVPFVYLMMQAHIILTDSGGIQEEAPSLGKPVLVMREVTERPEAEEAGTVKLVGTDADRITREAVRLLEYDRAYVKMAHSHNPYGDGHASERILRSLIDGGVFNG